MKKTYEIITWWSDEDKAYLATTRKVGFICHGDTEAEAVKELFVAIGLDRQGDKQENEWWEVPGVVVEFIGHGGTLGRLVEDGIAIGGDEEDVITWDELKTEKYKYKPVGVPFENMNKYTTEIYFITGKYKTKINIFNRYGEVQDSFNWYNCPKEWEGKTFPVTEELKKLLGVIE